MKKLFLRAKFGPLWGPWEVDETPRKVFTYCYYFSHSRNQKLLYSRYLWIHFWFLECYKYLIILNFQLFKYLLDFIVKLTVKTLPSTLPTPKVLSPGLAAPVQVSCCLIFYRIISLSVKEFQIFSKIQFDKFSHFENFQVRTSVSLLLKFNRMHLK